MLRRCRLPNKAHFGLVGLVGPSKTHCGLLDLLWPYGAYPAFGLGSPLGCRIFGRYHSPAFNIARAGQKLGTPFFLLSDV